MRYTCIDGPYRGVTYESPALSIHDTFNIPFIKIRNFEVTWHGQAQYVPLASRYELRFKGFVESPPTPPYDGQALMDYAYKLAFGKIIEELRSPYPAHQERLAIIDRLEAAVKERFF